ncbi:MAG: hypothetical protein GF346_03100, partial [Candidatus Eisenbacteria bacterium]|nr:hypothetical protein [Candidatus Latescibacterota bacterium]MBD3301408.1 hypothetical protein [Candidatus Eisenbacteria bacterium]
MRTKSGTTNLLPAGLLIAALLACVATAGAAGQEIRLLRAGPEGADVEILLPEAVVTPARGHPGYHELRVGSLPNDGEPGEPGLPWIGFW